MTRGPSPDQGGPREVLEAERASATPAGLITDDATGVQGPTRPEGPAVSGPLEALEGWFFDVISHPGTVSEGIGAHADDAERLGANQLEQLVTASSKASATHRMGIYHYAYRARLVECLIDDFPAVRAMMGKPAFRDLCHRYITDRPSGTTSLNWFGRQFADYCAGLDDLEHGPLIVDLARLEWAMVEVFHAEPAEVASLATLQQIPQEKWPEVRLPAADTLAVLRFGYPVNELVSAVKKGDTPDRPEPGTTHTAVYRKGYSVWRMDLTPPMARVLDALLHGAPLGEALAVLSAEEVGENDVMKWFQEWVMGGFFARVEL